MRNHKTTSSTNVGKEKFYVCVSMYFIVSLLLCYMFTCCNFINGNKMGFGLIIDEQHIQSTAKTTNKSANVKNGN